MVNEAILKYLLSTSIDCIYSRLGCKLYSGKYTNSVGIYFDGEAIIKVTSNINFRIELERIEDFYFNFFLGSITLESGEFKKNIIEVQPRYKVECSAQLIMRPLFGPIERITVLGYDLNRLTESKSLWGENNKTTQNILLFHAKDSEKKLIFLPDHVNCIYVTDNILEINGIIEKRGLIIEKEIT